MAWNTAISTILGLGFTCTVFSETWIVDDDGKADFDNIQAAVDAALEGDEIVVMPGVYTSSQNGHVINMLGKGITLRSSDPSNPDIVQTTIIDGNGERRGISCFNGESNYTRIRGLSFINCFSADFDYNNNGTIDLFETAGGGMYCIGSSPIVSDCRFTHNVAIIGGGAFCASESYPIFEKSLFTNNTANNYGGGLSCYLSNPTIADCIFQSNTTLTYGAGGMSCLGGNAIIDNCSFLDNHANTTGGGLSCVAADSTVTHCLFEGNSATEYGGGIFCDFAMPAIIECTIKNNIAGISGGGMGEANFSAPRLLQTTVCSNEPNQIDGHWVDEGGNTIANNCEIDCPDTNGDDTIGVGDLLAVIDAWGESHSPADVNDDSTVDVLDLLLVVGNWGPCH